MGKIGPWELIIILVILMLAGIGIYSLIRLLARPSDNSKTESAKRAGTTQTADPLEVLKLRLAKGEITKEQFEEMKLLVK